MRSLHLLALTAAIVAAGAACGDDNGNGGNGPDNEAPTASFTAPACQQGTACTFTDASTDSDGSIASRTWTFENGTPGTSTQATQAVIFSASGPQTVGLTVTDNEGASDDFSLDVTVTAPPTGNQPPVAGFTVECSSLDCTFTNITTDPEGEAVTSVWAFGDGNTSGDASPSHTYSVTALTTFNVTLTVTDPDGATDTETQEIDVSPPATLTCGDGTEPDCELLIEAPATVVVTLESEDCELDGNTFKVIIDPPATDPVEEILFTDGCNETAPQSFNLQNGAVIVAGTVITAQVISGGTNLELPPAIRVTGDFATGWRLEFDDGAKAGPPPEPDFNDLILTIRATP
jgi:hypothetical protein